MLSVLCAIVFLSPGQLPDLGGRLPRLDLPGLENLLKKGDPLSTSLADADLGMPFLDDWDPGNYKLITQDDRTGRVWKLKPGYYKIQLQSYCLHAGRPAPWAGDGMVDGPWKGESAKLLLDVIRRADLRPDLSQADVQYLLWAILARAKPSKLRGRVREAALQLLTKEELARLEGGGLDVIEDRAMAQLLGRFNSALRPVLEAENKLRGMLYDGNRSLEEMERVAILPPIQGKKSEIPKMRWLWRPEGYAIRYDAQTAWRLDVYVVVPHTFTITRDAKGRITRLEGPPGYVSEVEYDDSTPGIVYPADHNLTIYKFTKVTVTAPGHKETFDVDGWTFVGVPRTGETEPENLPLYVWKTVSQGGSKSDQMAKWNQRYENAKKAKSWYDKLKKLFERDRRIKSGQPSDEDFTDVGHYRDGVKAALKDPASRWDWLGDHQQRQAEGLLHAADAIRNLGNDPDTDVDPSGRVGLPGNSAAQRLGMGTRTR
ncbi:MAG: hypothetical protein D6724_02255 [Armatimonadetes bacterium]|nr:MAG: hypothetical protein D6724_02255 [Armatimonadota bacterium]